MTSLFRLNKGKHVEHVIICSVPLSPRVIFLLVTTLLSPPPELSPSLAALTVGCESGYLDPLSRVQLLLLDRPEPESPPSPFSLEEEEEDWLHLRMQSDAGLTSAGIAHHVEDKPADEGELCQVDKESNQKESNQIDMNNEQCEKTNNSY